MTLEYTLRDGSKTTDTITWAKLYEDPEVRHVKRTERIGSDNKVVSTIWQGMPHLMGEDRTFETVVLSGGVIISETYYDPTEEAALATHDMLIAQVERGEI